MSAKGEVYDWAAEDAFGDREALNTVYRNSRIVHEMFEAQEAADASE